jgi:hypothetical protein
MQEVVGTTAGPGGGRTDGAGVCEQEKVAVPAESARTQRASEEVGAPPLLSQTRRLEPNSQNLLIPPARMPESPETPRHASFAGARIGLLAIRVAAD